jgi:preprotein translocase subunit YajC
MQNITEGLTVAYEGQLARVVKVLPYTVDLVLEDGTKVSVYKNAVQPRDFLTEIENDGKDIL